VYVITDLYSTFRSEDTEALDAAQEDYVSLNRWVFKWHLKVRMFLHSRISADREFQVDGAAAEKGDGPVRCIREERPAAEHWMSAEPI